MQERSRVALVVGSRYGAAGDRELDFAPDAAARFAEVLKRSANGWALYRGEPLIDPTVEGFKNAVEGVIAQAHAASAQLLISFVGHGRSKASTAGAGASYPSFYLQVQESDPNPRADRDFNVGVVLRDRLEGHTNIDGVILVIDACQAGALPAEAVTNWREVTGGRLEVLVASDHDHSAYAGCFTTTLTRILEDGLADGSDYILPIQVVSPINTQCTDQRASQSGFTHGNRNAQGQFDEGLSFAMNRQRPQHALFGRPDAGVIDQVTREVALSIIEVRLGNDLSDAGGRLRWVTGPAGAGKSTVAAGLIRPSSLPLRRRGSTVKAAAFLDATTTVDALSRELAQQLTDTLDPEFAQRHSQSQEASKALPAQPSLDTELLIPLRSWPNATGERVEIVLDGFDQLDDRNSPAIIDAIRCLTGDEALPLVRVIATSRHDPPTGLADLNPVLFSLAGPSWAEVREHVTNGDVRAVLPDDDSPCPNGWLLGRLAAALATPPPDHTLKSIATTYLEQILDTLPEETQELAIHALSLLAVTPTGPVLPLIVLKEALNILDQQVEIPALRDLLVTLAPLIQRGKPGFPDEHAGLAHEEISATFADTLLEP